MKISQAQQRASQLREQASLKENLAINAMRLSANTASNNIMLSGVGVVQQVDANHYARLSGVVGLLSMKRGALLTDNSQISLRQRSSTVRRQRSRCKLRRLSRRRRWPRRSGRSTGSEGTLSRGRQTYTLL
jgi:hypothetical protein